MNVSDSRAPRRALKNTRSTGRPRGRRRNAPDPARQKRGRPVNRLYELTELCGLTYGQIAHSLNIKRESLTRAAQTGWLKDTHWNAIAKMFGVPYGTLKGFDPMPEGWTPPANAPASAPKN